MQRVATNVEEEMIVKAIEEDSPWDKLPKRLKLFLSSNEEYQKRVKEYCIKKRLKWSDCAARNACKENEYYDDLVRYLRKNLALFPYHLAENVCRILRISPFKYYIEMLYEIMKSEKPYDSIPNFSAADALRLTGIGRNEFIDIMNKCRAKKIMWKLNKSIVKEMLPTQPVDSPMEPWWIVCVVNLTVEEYRKLTEEEMVVISEKGGKDEVNLVGELDIDVVRALHRRGLVYLDVPVYPDDHFQGVLALDVIQQTVTNSYGLDPGFVQYKEARFSLSTLPNVNPATKKRHPTDPLRLIVSCCSAVSALDGFVSNKNQQYEDPTEELLYAVFVASSEHTTIEELSQTLQADIEQLQSAVSLASRLGWAKKVLDPASLLRDSGMPGSPLSEGSVSSDSFLSPFSSPFREGLSEVTDGDSFKGIPGSTRFALMVDANLTSYLMMGSLSPGLKGHAVTLFEAGKLGDSSVAEMCEDLRGVEGTKLEGELQNFADHAFSLRHALECLRSGGMDAGAMETSGDGAVDSEEIEKSGSGSNADFDFNLLPIDSNDLLGQEPSSVMEDDIFGFKSRTEGDKFVPPSDDSGLTSLLDLDTLPASQLSSSSSAGDGGPAKGKPRGRKSGGWKSRVDVIRMESLAGLAPATVQRVLRRDYDVVVSMIPLPSPPSVVSPDGTGPVHFGPPSRAAITPWMKLLLYEAAGSGPVSVVLMRGLRFRFLPPLLKGCAKALVWAWDGVAVSGVGGKFEGTLVEGGVLLHCINSLLKHSAILIQPFSRACLDDSGNGKPMVKINPIPYVAKDGEQLPPSIVQAVNELNLRTMGYIRLVKVMRMQSDQENQSILPGSYDYEWVPQCVEFGVPLFDTELCKDVCQGVIQSDLFHAASLLKHREDMQNLRRRLMDLISDYQANGAEAILTYSGGHPRMTSLNSRRWSLEEGDGVGHMNMSTRPRRRFRSEVGSFDGDLPRSFNPVFEPPTRIVEASVAPPPSLAAQKLDFGDDDDVSDVPLPGVNLLFDGRQLKPLHLDPCLQGRLPVALVSEAIAATEALRNPFPT